MLKIQQPNCAKSPLGQNAFRILVQLAFFCTIVLLHLTLVSFCPSIFFFHFPIVPHSLSPSSFPLCAILG